MKVYSRVLLTKYITKKNCTTFQPSYPQRELTFERCFVGFNPLFYGNF